MSLAHETTTLPGRRQEESAREVADHFGALPLQAQLGVLRTIAPRVLAQLGPEQRQGFVRDLFGEVDLALMGAQPYDIRTRSPEPLDTHAYLHADHGWWMGETQPVRSSSAALRGQASLRWPKGYTPSDQRVHEDVCEQLGHTQRLDVSDIEVTVTEGEVTLTGTVPTRIEKYVAEEVAESPPGVREVHNLLRVARPEDIRADRRARRHEGRANATYHAFLRRVAANLRMPPERAELILISVLHALEQRITADESADLLSQLPFKLQEVLMRTHQDEGLRPRDIDRDVFLNMIADDLGVSLNEAETMAQGIFRTLNEAVSPGEVRQARQQLPPDLRQLWPR